MYLLVLIFNNLTQMKLLLIYLLYILLFKILKRWTGKKKQLWKKKTTKKNSFLFFKLYSVQYKYCLYTKLVNFFSFFLLTSFKLYEDSRRGNEKA